MNDDVMLEKMVRLKKIAAAAGAIVLLAIAIALAMLPRGDELMSDDFRRLKIGDPYSEVLELDENTALEETGDMIYSTHTTGDGIFVVVYYNAGTDGALQIRGIQFN